MVTTALLKFILLFFPFSAVAQPATERSVLFNEGWKLLVGEVSGAGDTLYNDANWQAVELPHDGSIEGAFDQKNPAGVHGAYLPTGAGYYRKVFVVEESKKDKCLYIDFDGIYRNSEVWINGHLLGKRPNGYISFRYDLTPWLLFNNRRNVLLVKVDNKAQPNSRWYTGSGIYRNVWLTTTGKLHIDHWGVHISAAVSNSDAIIDINTSISNRSGSKRQVSIRNIIIDKNNRQVAEKTSLVTIENAATVVSQKLSISNPHFWSDTDPYLYKVLTQVSDGNKVIDEMVTNYGIRYFRFDPRQGFILNGKPAKIKGVCNHHDLGCLGAAVNRSAIKRQLQLLKDMGCNAIRTAHNAPAPELLELCDEMGFFVMDEAFDVWEIAKTPFDYHWNWNEWHRRDLEDQVKRDRNHPSVIIWSIGNEIPEQLEGKNGGAIAKELKSIIRQLDATRPVTAGNNHPMKNNLIIQSGALDLVGCNYRHNYWEGFPEYYPGQSFIGTETVSALQTRGEYMFPSDKVYRWGDAKNPVTKNPVDYTCSSFDQVSAPWGSTHEESLRLFKKHAFISGMFVWSGFDYLGEPTPYSWPARSSYFGIIDMAGFPKDVYYLYQSEWTDKTVLHLFPHWNWQPGQQVDVWAYYNNADEVELFVNGKSAGTRRKNGEEMHVLWRIPFQPGALQAISRRQGREVLRKEIKTAGKPASIVLQSDKMKIDAGKKELAFVTAKVMDEAGNLVPYTDNLVSFEINGDAFVAGTDNGNPVSHESFKSNARKAFNGLALSVIQAGKNARTITLTARSAGLQPATIIIRAQ